MAVFALLKKNQVVQEEARTQRGRCVHFDRKWRSNLVLFYCKTQPKSTTRLPGRPTRLLDPCYYCSY